MTVEYDGDIPVRLDTIVVSAQHHPDIEPVQLRADLVAQVIRPQIPKHLLDERTRILINPTAASSSADRTATSA